MGLRINKSIKIAPGVRIRLGSKSSSLSVGGKAGRVTLNSRGRRTTNGAPRTWRLLLFFKGDPFKGDPSEAESHCGWRARGFH